MATFYFTYGSDEQFPFQYGWTEIEAPDIATASAVFRHYHPARDPEDPRLNCATIYTEEQFKDAMDWLQAHEDNETEDVTMTPDKLKKKCLREIARKLASTAMTLFGLSIMRGVVILDVDAKNNSVLLDSGIEKFANIHDLPIETEPAEDENDPFAFKVVRLYGGMEVLQVDDEYVPEEEGE